MMDLQKPGLKLQCSLLASIVHDYLLPFEPLMLALCLGTISPLAKKTSSEYYHAHKGGGGSCWAKKQTNYSSEYYHAHKGGFMLGEKTSIEYSDAHRGGGGGGGG